MAIGTLAAVAIGGGLLGSAALSSNASKNAGKTVANATDRAAQLQNEQFEKLLQLQMPGYNRGEQAAGVYMQALGIPSMTGGGGSPSYGGGSGLMTGGTGGGADWNGYLQANPDVMAAVQGGGFGGDGGLTGAAQRHYLEYGQREGRALPGQATTGQVGTGTQVPALSIADQVMQTPGYQTQLDQGLKSIDRAAPLTGGMYSGRRMKALNDYGQNTFGSYYQDWMNRVGGVAGQGQQVAQNVGQAGMQNAQNVGGLMVQGANAKAQGSLNSAAAWTNAMNTGLGMVGGAKGWF